jgi:hypothetical protein
MAFCREPLSEADKSKGRDLVNVYTKLMWKRHHVMNRDLQRKLRLKWAAIHALPTAELRRDALFVDPYVPLRIRVPTQTPPLAGFHSDLRLDDSGDASNEPPAPAATDSTLSKQPRSAAEFAALGSAARSRRGSGGSSVVSLSRSLQDELRSGTEGAASGGGAVKSAPAAKKGTAPASQSGKAKK